MGRYNEDVITCMNCGKPFTFEPEENVRQEIECYHCGAIHIYKRTVEIKLKNKTTNKSQSSATDEITARVRVVKAKYPFYWYAKYIGWHFQVGIYSDEEYIIVDDNEKFDGNTLNRLDCEII